MLNLDNSDGNADASENPASSKTPAQRDEESSQLLAKKNAAAAVFFEPPYSAPLAPYDMELVKKFRLHDNLIASDSVWSGNSKQNKRDVNTTRFINSERESDAGKAKKSSNESLSLHEKRARFAER